MSLHAVRVTDVEYYMGFWYCYGNEQSRPEQQEPYAPYVSPAPGSNPSPGSLEALRAERAMQRSAGPPAGGDGVGWGGGGAARAEQLEAAWRAQQASLLLGLFVPSRPAWVICFAPSRAALRAASLERETEGSQTMKLPALCAGRLAHGGGSARAGQRWRWHRGGSGRPIGVWVPTAC